MKQILGENDGFHANRGGGHPPPRRWFNDRGPGPVQPRLEEERLREDEGDQRKHEDDSHAC